MNRVALALYLLALSACGSPTLQQRADAWRAYQGATRVTCVVGVAKDSAMPDDVKRWCGEVVGP